MYHRFTLIELRRLYILHVLKKCKIFKQLQTHSNSGTQNFVRRLIPLYHDINDIMLEKLNNYYNNILALLKIKSSLFQKKKSDPHISTF